MGGGLLTIDSKNINTRESRRTIIICTNIKKYLKNWCVLRNRLKIEERVVIQRKKYCS